MSCNVLCCVLLLAVSVYAAANKGEKCLEPLEPGPCSAQMPSWGYDSDLEQCVKFTYGGCGGNANNFASAGDCIDKCEHPRSCYDEENQVWYAHQENKGGGYGCGGCTCNDGLFECGSCNAVPLVCRITNCDNKCDYGYQNDEQGCQTCDCKLEPGNFLNKLKFYCQEFCSFCRSNSKLQCPSECDCY
ncbi:BPTI/Kunitz domain-containing protein-like [Acanthaster planci]|uniref:BPTI/Kunitz domain-containing protein-like n=1 Tax=Acanthaster planci TaxID=133434 RepID=A0A8B8A111_ACAPL|nr:BPTI/Kunitz domain-containing protein-like [Acanthaster planci]